MQSQGFVTLMLDGVPEDALKGDQKEEWRSNLSVEADNYRQAK